MKNRVIYPPSCVVRVTQFFLLFFTRALLRGIRGILFKLEMFSKRITICGGVRRCWALGIRDRITLFCV